MRKNRGFSSTVVILIVVLLLIGGAYYLGTRSDRPPQNNGGGNTAREIEGNTNDLVAFSVSPGDKVSGILSFSGTVKNAYFFEANIGVNILDENKKLLKAGHGTATTEWMTSEPVSFSGSIDLSGLTPGPGYIQIQNDNPSDMREYDKFIYISVIIGP